MRKMYIEMVRSIVSLREEGLRYKEIDILLDLPWRSYKIMRRRTAKRIAATL